MKQEIQELSTKAILETNRNVLILGKAGTGKTTFLNNLIKERKSGKNIQVLAPTGVASKNANGRTIHSFLKLSTSVFIPGKSCFRRSGLSNEEQNYVRSLDTIIIDEISMVRADLLDQMDWALRLILSTDKPFGGIQIVMIGDLKQLPPIVCADEELAFFSYYTHTFFFGSKVFREMSPLFFEFDKVYRQSNIDFVDTLKRVRDNCLTAEDYRLLNSRVNADIFKDSILLSARRSTVKKINNQKLNEISSPEFIYRGKKEGYYPDSEYPAPIDLSLKVGARVMFVKNARDKKYVNGTLGTVISLSEQKIIVRTDEGYNVTVEKEYWRKYTTKLDANTGRIYKYEQGFYCQYPLILAWAVTIHKSQGITFDSVILDLKDCFEVGQAYVALSRCRSLDRISLTSTINRASIKTSYVVDSFIEDMKNKWNEEKLMDEIVNSCSHDTRFVHLIYDKEVAREKLEETRRNIAEKENTTRNLIMSKHEVRTLADQHPRNEAQLKPMFGNPYIRKYAEELLSAVNCGYSISA